MNERLPIAAAAIILFVCAACQSARTPRIVASASGIWGTAWQAEYSRDIVLVQSQDDSRLALTKRESIRLERGWWSTVENALSEAHFFELPERIQQTPRRDGTITVMTDDRMLCVEDRGRSKRRVCGFSMDIKLSSEGTRFADVWNELVSAVPTLAGEKITAASLPHD